MPSEQILLLAFFIVFALVQALIRRWQGKRQAEIELESPRGSEPPAQPERVWQEAAEAPPRVFPELAPPFPPPSVYEPPEPVPPPFSFQVQEAAPAPVRPPSAPRAAADETRRRDRRKPAAREVQSANRFIVPRDRAGLQRAVALMVILGPPRSLDPPK